MAYTIYYPGNTCAEQSAAHFCSPCDNEIVKGRVRAVGFYDPDVVWLDITDTAEWVTNIGLGKATVINKVRGSYDGGEIISTDGYGNDPLRVTGFTAKLNFKDPALKHNRNFYNSMMFGEKKKVAWLLDGGIMRTSALVVTVAAKDPVSESMDDDVVWDVECTLKEKSIPQYYNAPENVFDKCFGFTAVCKMATMADDDIITGVTVSATTYTFESGILVQNIEEVLNALINTGLSFWEVSNAAGVTTIKYTTIDGGTWTACTGTFAGSATPGTCV